MVARKRYSPFDFEYLPHRVTVWDPYSHPVWERKLPADTDLRKEFAALLEYWRSLGWEIDEPYQLQVFMRKDGDRLFLFIHQERATA